MRATESVTGRAIAGASKKEGASARDRVSRYCLDLLIMYVHVGQEAPGREAAQKFIKRLTMV
jgi:hypothetical protein